MAFDALFHLLTGISLPIHRHFHSVIRQQIDRPIRGIFSRIYSRRRKAALPGQAGFRKRFGRNIRQFPVSSFLPVPDSRQRSEPGQGGHNAGNRPIERPDGPGDFNVPLRQMIENLKNQKNRRQREKNNCGSPTKNGSPTRFLFLVVHLEASACRRRPALGTNSEPAGPKISKRITGSGTTVTAAGSGVNAAEPAS
jgi:hypothetical protein